jgi:beta-lactam-binding protein with PASTA domain
MVVSQSPAAGQHVPNGYPVDIALAAAKGRQFTLSQRFADSAC